VLTSQSCKGVAAFLVTLPALYSVTQTGMLALAGSNTGEQNDRHGVAKDMLASVLTKICKLAGREGKQPSVASGQAVAGHRSRRWVIDYICKAGNLKAHLVVAEAGKGVCINMCLMHLAALSNRVTCSQTKAGAGRAATDRAKMKYTRISLT
jgi:hypothetical protein